MAGVGRGPGAHPGVEGGGGARLASEGIFQAQRQVLGNRGQGLEQPSRSCLLLQGPPRISCPSSPADGTIPGSYTKPPGLPASCPGLLAPTSCPSLLAPTSCPGPAGVPRSSRGRPSGKMYFLDPDIPICGVER